MSEHHTMTKRIKVIIDKRGRSYVQVAKKSKTGKRKKKVYRIKGEHDMSQADLVKFLVKRFAPKRRRKQRTATKITAKQYEPEGYGTTADEASSRALRRTQLEQLEQIVERNALRNLVTSAKPSAEDSKVEAKAAEALIESKVDALGRAVNQLGNDIVQGGQRLLEEKKREAKDAQQEAAQRDVERKAAEQKAADKAAELKVVTPKAMAAIIEKFNQRTRSNQITKEKFIDWIRETIPSEKKLKDKTVLKAANLPGDATVFKLIEHFTEQGDRAPQKFKKLRDAAIEDAKKQNPQLQFGSGAMHPDGLNTDQIEGIMSRYKDFYGALARDEINTIKPRGKRVAFVLNTDPSNKPGKHWVAVYIDARPGGANSVEWYDSYADDMPSDIKKDVKTLVDKLKPDTYLKLKENKVVHQSDRTNNCGVFAVRFLMDRFRDKTFAEATGYEDRVKSAVGKNEREIEKLKNTPAFTKYL